MVEKFGKNICFYTNFTFDLLFSTLFKMSKMKKIYGLLMAAFICTIHANAQTFTIDTSTINFENKLRPCLVVQYDASPKEVKKAWASYMKKNYKIKIKGISLISDKRIIDAQDVSIPFISDKRMNMYASVEDKPTGSELRYFMSFGYDFFIGPENYPSSFQAMDSLLKNFSEIFLTKFYADETADYLKEIKGYERDIKKKNKSIEKNIKSSKKSSVAVASALESKNTALRMEIQQIQSKIDKIKSQIDIIKQKQEGIIVK